MGAPITIKKRKLGLQSAIKETSSGEPPAEGAEMAPEAANQGAGMFTPPTAFAAAKPASYTLVGILAIFATIFFIGLLTIQWIEWTDLDPHFPKQIQTGHIVSQGN
ncbi:MAG TPA: hypothetical protein DCS43_07845 [Verrucomicrobia bacterium]|nr:hypothetical protein [Verrucomicrobiota bacterium]